MPHIAKKAHTVLDREQIICNLAWDYCTRYQRGEPVELNDFLQRKQLSDPNDASQFLVLVNMNMVLNAIEGKSHRCDAVPAS